MYKKKKISDSLNFESKIKILLPRSCHELRYCIENFRLGAGTRV